uniref:Transcription initiation factor TFIID subunit 9 n=1 Tax=Clastoptera arizonana TaxID=38151 RepID=A0A1B6D6I3_9HEMI
MAAPNSAPVKQIPKDAQVIMSILKELGINDYEPRVVNQLLEFTYRYVTCILDDARVYANHSKKKMIDLDDVRLAVTMQLDRVFTTPPPRDILLEIAKSKNNCPLPLVKPHCGIRLPPDRYCLSSCNYRLKSIAKKGKQFGHGGANSSNFTSSIQQGMKISSKVGPSLQLVKRTNTMSTVPRTQSITAPKPVIKFSTNIANQKLQVKPKIQISSLQNQVDISSQIKMEIDESNPLKRKREDDFDGSGT